MNSPPVSMLGLPYVSKVLYASPNLGTAIRWVPPTVANGHVYMGVGNKIVSYGLAP